MKKLILAVAVVALCLLGITCSSIPANIDHEIKDLVKDIPVPTLYSTSTGEVLEFHGIKVEMFGERKFDKFTGVETTLYLVKAIYDGAELELYRPSPPPIEEEVGYYAEFNKVPPPQNIFTIAGIRQYHDELYWK